MKAGKIENTPEVDNFLVANTNKIAATVRTKFPAWYTKHYGRPDEEKLYKRILSSMLDTELVQEYSGLGVDLKSLVAVVDNGLHRLVRECKTPPNPQDIIELFLRIDGLPDFETAWHEALAFQGKRSHPVITAAANAVGVFELRQSSVDNYSLKDRFKTQFIIKSRLFRIGKDLSGHNKTIGHDSNKKTLAELAELAWTEHDKKIQQRINAQGVSKNPKEARLQALTMLGLKPKEAIA